MRMLTAFSALRAGKVFAADNISVIASCREDAASCQLMIDYYRELGHDFTESYGLVRTDTGIH